MRVFKFFSLFLIFFGFSVSIAFAPTAKPLGDFSDVYKKYQEAVENGDYSQAVNYAQGAYDLGKEKFEGGSQEISSLAYNLGFVLNQVHEFEEALPFLYEGLNGLKFFFGAENIILLDSFMELGKANVGLFKSRSAKRYFSQAIELVKKEYGDENSLLLEINLEIGNFIYVNSQAGAEDYFEQAYLIGTTYFPEGNYRTGIAAFSLGKFLIPKNERRKPNGIISKPFKFMKKRLRQALNLSWLHIHF